MADINFQLRLITTGAEISRDILSRCADEINRRIFTGTARNDIRRITQAILEFYIMSQPEYDSLKGGVLKAELGVEDTAAIDRIIKLWVRGVDVVVAPATVVGSKIIGDIIITAIPADYSDVLSSSAASYITDKGETVPWLSWLLLQGDNIVIATHRAVYDPDKSKSSRTGTDIMLPTDTEGWRVPPEFSGTVDNNFVTRAVVAALPDLRAALEANIRSRL